VLTALPFVVPEYMFNFASMNRARAAGLTLPYLLNVRAWFGRMGCGRVTDADALGRWAWWWTRWCSMRWHGLQVAAAAVLFAVCGGRDIKPPPCLFMLILTRGSAKQRGLGDSRGHR
jgi:hypothetical protein